MRTASKNLRSAVRASVRHSRFATSSAKAFASINNSRANIPKLAGGLVRLISIVLGKQRNVAARVKIANSLVPGLRLSASNRWEGRAQVFDVFVNGERRFEILNYSHTRIGRIAILRFPVKGAPTRGDDGWGMLFIINVKTNQFYDNFDFYQFETFVEFQETSITEAAMLRRALVARLRAAGFKRSVAEFDAQWYGGAEALHINHESEGYVEKKWWKRTGFTNEDFNYFKKKYHYVFV